MDAGGIAGIVIAVVVVVALMVIYNNTYMVHQVNEHALCYLCRSDLWCAGRGNHHRAVWTIPPSSSTWPQLYLADCGLPAHVLMAKNVGHRYLLGCTRRQQLAALAGMWTYRGALSTKLQRILAWICASPCSILCDRQDGHCWKHANTSLSARRRTFILATPCCWKWLASCFIAS